MAELVPESIYIKNFPSFTDSRRHFLEVSIVYLCLLLPFNIFLFFLSVYAITNMRSGWSRNCSWCNQKTASLEQLGMYSFFIENMSGVGFCTENIPLFTPQ